MCIYILGVRYRVASQQSHTSSTEQGTWVAAHHHHKVAWAWGVGHHGGSPYSGARLAGFRVSGKPGTRKPGKPDTSRLILTGMTLARRGQAEGAEAELILGGRAGVAFVHNGLFDSTMPTAQGQGEEELVVNKNKRFRKDKRVTVLVHSLAC